MIKAIIFDMDGVIADTQKIHAEIESEILGRYAVKITPEEVTKRYAGVQTADFFNELLKDKNINIDSLLKEKWNRVLEKVRISINEIPGANLIKECKSIGLKTAVASASSSVFVEAVLSALKIKNIFDAIATSEEVLHGKPAPDVFLLAADRLSVISKECVVIEDGISGMQGAKAAGMKCIGLTDDKFAPADLVIKNFNEIKINQILDL